jgi:hypothetical protein
MSTIKHPVGPQSPEVYRRRRLWVLLGAAAVIVIIILIITGVARGNAKGSSTAKPALSTSATPKASAAALAGAACIPSRLKLEAVTDKATYATGVQPSISMKLTNIGTTDCTVNFGSTQQELIVTSGSEKIWDSKDCQTAPVDAPTVLKPNVAVATPGIPWDRTRSATTTCSTARTAVTAGGASYHLQAKLGTLASKDTVQFILN